MEKVAHARTVIKGETTLAEVGHFLIPKPVVAGIDEGTIVELIAGPFKGEKAVVKRVDSAKEEITVELYESIVPIPITVTGRQCPCCREIQGPVIPQLLFNQTLFLELVSSNAIFFKQGVEKIGNGSPFSFILLSDIKGIWVVGIPVPIQYPFPNKYPDGVDSFQSYELKGWG